MAEKKNTGVITLDCYTKVQLNPPKAGCAVQIIKQTGYFKDMHLAGLDYEEIFFELQRYRNEKACYNLNIARLILSLQDNSWYKLLILGGTHA